MDTLGIEANSLSIGESTQVYCPYCDNSPPYSKSMSLTRVATGAVFYCFRASCSAKGFIPLNGKPTRTYTRKKQKPYRFALQPFSSIPDKTVLPISHYLWDKEGVKYNPTLNTIVFPVYSWEGKQIGVVDRSYYGREPKAINFIDEDAVKLHFPFSFNRNSKSCCIVEDIPSSIAVNTVYPCCSILGTTVTQEAIEALVSRFETLIICLDRDARGKAISLKRKLRGLFKQVRVVLVEKDPKDMNKEELLEIFGEYK